MNIKRLYEDLELFKDLEPADLDYLGIVNNDHRAKLLTAVQLLHDIDESLIITVAIALVNGATEFCHTECSNNICRGIENNTAIPSEAGCADFFICINGRPIPNTCPSGQWFNSNTSLCDSAPNPECNPSEEFQCPPTGVHFFPHDDYCEKFIMCFAGFPIISRCADGLYFDRELNTCNLPEYAECKLAVCPPGFDHENITFVPSEKDCEKFYICYGGEPLEFWCAPGIHFNPVTNQCDFPENANCTIERDDGPDVPLPHEIDCDCAEGIYFVPHPNSCEHYFICSAGESILFDCAPGFYFDSVNNWCDLPENVQCDATTTSPPCTACRTTTTTTTPLYWWL